MEEVLAFCFAKQHSEITDNWVKGVSVLPYFTHTAEERNTTSVYKQTQPMKSAGLLLTYFLCVGHYGLQISILTE
jgi:hypothetical protein